jgi:DNA repair photolyase
MMRVREVRAKSILNKSKIFDYCLNPFTGCRINCAYCYARLFMRRYSGHREPWGEFVDVKVNAPELLEKQLCRAKPGRVWISSVCDPYQPLEKTYELTRRCLAILASARFPVTVQTKSALVLRDLDILARFEDVEVGFTITTDDEETAGLFERAASPVPDRFDALGRLHEAGIRTFAFVGPILPGDPEQLVRRLAGRADRVFVDRMNYTGTVRGFYRRYGLEWALTDRFFEEYRERLAGALGRSGVPFEIFF